MDSAVPVGQGTNFSAAYAFTPRLLGERAPTLRFGSLTLLSESGDLRYLDFTSIGAPDPDRPERSFALSPDGTQLAVADVGRIVVVDLDSGAQESFEVAAEQPVALEFTPDATSVRFVERRESSGPDASSVDITDGTVTPAANPVVAGSWASIGQVSFQDTKDGTEVLLRRVGSRSDTTLGRLPVRLDNQARPSCEALCVAIQSRTASLGQPVVRGLMSFDGRTGQFGPALSLTETETEGAEVLGWTGRQSIRFSVPTSDGVRVLDWSPATGSIREVAALALGDIQLAGVS